MSHENAISRLTEKPESYHEYSLPEQLAILQNLTLEHQFPNKIKDDWRLNPADVDLGELAIVYRLLYPDLQGAFAATAIEGINDGLRYLPANASEYHKKLLVRAVKNGLWDKYIAVWIHDDLRLMSEVVHSISLLAEGALKKPYYTASPGLSIPVYENALKNRKNVRNIGIIGAFSPISVMDLWLIHKKIIKPASPHSRMTIIDVNGELTPYFTRHYGIDYVFTNGMQAGLPSDALDVMISDFITPWLKDNIPTFENIEAYRSLLFREIYRVLKPGGIFVSCEEPVIPRYETDIKVACQRDKTSLKSQLVEAGFSHNLVTAGQRFRNRFEADQFLQNGHLPNLSVITPKGTTQSFQIIAQK